MTLRVAVTGGRKYSDRSRVFEILDSIHASGGVSLLMHGDASGADTLAKEWADARGVGQKPYAVTKEQWAKLGKKAGPLRNTWMLEDGMPDLVVAFPGGAGTADCVRKARRANITVAVIPPLAVNEHSLIVSE